MSSQRCEFKSTKFSRPLILSIRYSGFVSVRQSGVSHVPVKYLMKWLLFLRKLALYFDITSSILLSDNDGGF